MEFPTTVEMERLPEKLFDIEKLDNCIVRDKVGQERYIKDLRKGCTCIIIFVRHFLDYVTKEYVEDFSKIFPRDLQENEVKLIVIGCGPSRFIQPFCEETNFSHEMYCDSKRNIHKVLGLHESPQPSFGASPSPHVKSNFFTGFMTTLWRFAKSTIEQGDPFQQGGQLVISQSDEIAFFHRDTHSLDHTPINELLQVAGLPRIDFRLKYKIQDV